MNEPLQDNEIEELRQQILNAAENRFTTYGYGKTTMAEIAEDSNMSAANLYRYFQNKQDIASECAERCMCNMNTRLREATLKSNLSAAERLHAFAIEAYYYNLEMGKDSPKIKELVDFISQKHQQMVRQRIEAQIALIAEILAYGNQTGEFQIPDIISTAKTVYSTLVIFDVPIFTGMFSRDEYELMAKNVTNLLIEGIKKR